MEEVAEQIRKLLWVGWLILLPLGSPAQNIQPEVYVDPSFSYDHWTVEDGLPVNSINQVLQSQKGYIWFGTYDGLVRFDGIRFKVYKSAEYPGLPGNRILNLEETPDGILWLRTEQEILVRFNNDSFQEVTAKDGLNGSQVQSLYKDSNGRLWIGTNSGISVYEDGILRPYHPSRIDKRIILIYVDHNNVIWYKSDNPVRLYRFNGQQEISIAAFKNIKYPTPFLTLHDGSTLLASRHNISVYKNKTIREPWPDLPADIKIIDLVETGDSTVLAATLNHGIIKLAGRSPVTINPDFVGRTLPGFGGRMGRTLLQDEEDVWAVGDQMILFNNKKVFTFNDKVTDFVLDQEGSFWFGSSSSGLFRLKPNLFTTYSDNDPQTGNAVYPVIEASDGSIWFGHSEKIARLHNGELSMDFSYLLEPGDFSVRTIVERKTGKLLAGLGMLGIYELSEDGKTFRPYPVPVSPNENELIAHALYEDKHQRLWIGSNQGVFLKTKKGWERFTLMDSGYVRSFSEAPDGTIWMATFGGGIYLYRSGKFSNFSQQDGLASNLVRSIYVDTTSNPNNYLLWIGTEDKGMNRLPVKNGIPEFSEIVHYDEQSGLYDNVVHQILVDEYDRFWLSGNKGISWVSRSDLEKFARGSISEIHVTYYTERDGLLNREANGGVQSAGIISSDGKVWFPTQEGLVMIDPDDITQNEIPPPVVIEQIKSEENVISKRKGRFLLKPAQRDFEIAYTGLSLMVPEKVRFRYRLKGFNDNWVEAGTRRAAFYTNVPAGTYSFEVMAANNEGIWSPEAASVLVEIQPYFYETNIFYLFLVLAAGLVLFAVVQLRTRQLKSRERELENSVKERTRELVKEKKKTEQQARELVKLDKAKSRFFTNITHEFRTPITLILGPLQRLLDKGRDITMDEAYPEIERMSRNSHRLQRLIDQMLDISKLEKGELRLSVQKLEIVEFARRTLDMFGPLSSQQDQQLELKTSLSEFYIYVDPDALEKILSNLLSNAIKFTPARGRISVILEDSPTQLTIRVKDSGVGIPPDKTEHIFDRFYLVDDSSTRMAEGSGVGLALVKNLVELHQGQIDVHSVLGEGSTFTVRLKKGRDHFSESDLVTAPDDSEVMKPKTIAGSFKVEHGDGYGQTEEDPDNDRPTVLVVEDNSDMRDFVSSVLEESFRVVQAEDGEDALELVREHLPDLIVADIMMPKMDGLKLNEELKKDPMLETIPVIFLTAKTESESKLEGFREGADDYLTKPFDSEMLIARVENIIKKRQLLRHHILEHGTDNGEDQEVTDPFLKQVMGVLEKKFANPGFGVKELAEAIHLDRTQLYRKMKDASDQSPQQFLRDFRMKKAARMLLERKESISEVAYATGFNSLAYFSNVFKRYYKMSPSKYISQQELS